MSKTTEKPTKVGVITIDVYEDSFEVKASDAIDMFTVYTVSVAVQEYLEELSETLDNTYTKMLQ